MRDFTEITKDMMISLWNVVITPVLFSQWDIIFIIAASLSALLIVLCIIQRGLGIIQTILCILMSWVCAISTHANIWAWKYEGIHNEKTDISSAYTADFVEEVEYVVTKKSIKYFNEEIKNTPEELAINCFTSENTYRAYYENTSGLDISPFTYMCDEVTTPQTFKIHRKTYTFIIPFSHDVTYNIVTVYNNATGNVEEIIKY